MDCMKYEKPKKMKYIGESNWMYCLNGKIYDCIGEAHGSLKIIDESGEDYLYSPDAFEEVGNDGNSQPLL